MCSARHQGSPAAAEVHSAEAGPATVSTVVLLIQCSVLCRKVASLSHEKLQDIYWLSQSLPDGAVSQSKQLIHFSHKHVATLKLPTIRLQESIHKLLIFLIWTRQSTKGYLRNT